MSVADTASWDGSSHIGGTSTATAVHEAGGKRRMSTARDVMTTAVVSVFADTPVREIARLLLGQGISAVPVVDAEGLPLGMVSEGDLMGRNDLERVAGTEWWLQLLAGQEEVHRDWPASAHVLARTARDVMSAPVVAVGEDTSVPEIARLLTAHRIKRVPVVRDGRIVGIVSRANLLAVLLSQEETAMSRHENGVLSRALASLDGQFLHRRRPAEAPEARRPVSRSEEELPLAADFRDLVDEFERHEGEQRNALREAAAAQRRQQVKDLIDRHISDDKWRTLLHLAREAAHRGEKQLMLLRFPSGLCIDGGRAVNVAEPGWNATLRGAAAEMYLRWERDLKPHRFRLTASVLEFPDGLPGDIGLFLIWGDTQE